MSKKLTPIRLRRVFDINTYQKCKITETNHQREYTCTFPKGDSFKFSIDISRISFEPEFDCIYYDKDGRGVVLYRAKPNEHIKSFWKDLGNELFDRTSGYQDQLRNQVLKEFDFDWEG